MISYGGVVLPDITEEIEEKIEKSISTDDIHQWLVRHHPCPDSVAWFGENHDITDCVKLGRLYWPTHASRWSTAQYLATDKELKTIRQLAYPSSESDKYKALELKINHGNLGIKTDMYMLPARPLFKWVGGDNLYLLTLVDARWFWWEKSANITVTGGTTTWATLISSIASALGETITTDTISTAYLKPGNDLTQSYGKLPLLLDAVLKSIGHVLVRKLDGTLVTQAPLTARTAEDAEVAKYSVHAGGTFDLRV